MKRKFRILGPPGTGKTTYLARQVEHAVEKYGSDNVVVASYTRAAANVLNKRNLPIPRENVGTLHSLCYKAFKNHEIAEVHAAEFNEKNPGFEITPSKNNMEEMAVDAVYETEGDKHLSNYNLRRARCLPLEGMPADTIRWMKKWESWKLENKYIDFTDMITLALSMGDPLPGNPKIGIYDECQDFNKLEFQLLQHWAQFQEQVLFAGDDDQTIYDFCGADPKAFLGIDLPSENIRILKQSYRLPRIIHEYSQRWIKQVTLRANKEFNPKDEDGVLKSLNATYKTPEYAVDLAANMAQEGKTVMLLTTCSYMLMKIKQKLREYGLPFHNPYRVTRGDWNPLGSFKTSKNRLSTRERILAFFDQTNEYWDLEILDKWLDLVKVSEVLKRGGRDKLIDRLDSINGNTVDKIAFYHEIFRENVLEWVLKRDLERFRNVLLASKRNVAEYPLSVYVRRGKQALEENPKIIIGTIHCSPPDEKVLTTDGYIPMSELNPDVHRVASYMFKCNRFIWNTTNYSKKNRGYKFKIAKNPYNGPLLTVTTVESKTRITPDHRVRVKFADNFYNKWVVYLMRRGCWWRVGVCTSGRIPYCSGGVLGRLATEKGDEGWILKVCETRKEALIEEEIIRGKYGITGLTFQSAKNRSLNIKDLHRIHEAINGSTTPRIAKLFADFCLAMDAPLYKRNAGPQRVRNTYAFEIPAFNLISGYMLFPVIKENAKSGTHPKWLPLTVEKNHYDGDVYSLEVKPYEHYVSGGAIVHNSVKGGEADAVILFPDISLAAAESYNREKDSIIRTFYVGMTRARNALYLAQPSSSLSVKFQ